jgi:hypothetical protein
MAGMGVMAEPFSAIAESRKVPGKGPSASSTNKPLT